MDEPAVRAGLAEADITVGPLHRNLPAPELIARSLARGEGIFAANGALVVTTGERTGRSPADRYIVDEPEAADVAWNGVNQPCTPEFFDRQVRRVSDYLRRREVYVFDGFIGTDPNYRTPIRVVSRASWHGLFAHTLFVRPEPIDLEGFDPAFTLINCGELPVDARPEGENGGGGDRPSQAFVGISFSRRLILILGTMYGGETKKSLFTTMNYLLPARDVLPMHCSATAGVKGDVALYFGLSGTGKTSLSADPTRRLIGDDEHGWDDEGVFNFEGGCYAKLIRLSQESEPEIYECTRRFGTVLENVAFDSLSRRIDLDDDSFTENTRGAYPLSYIPNALTSGTAGHPKNVIMLTCDAFGVLPPISRLTPEQAVYHFLSGYTAKVAGTESGMGKEPQATFSTCFGAPFMALHPSVYAEMLKDKIARHNVNCWLVNTGWSGGGYGVGSRIKIKYSRAMINAALNGVFTDIAFETEPFFGLSIPKSCPEVPGELLNPRNIWSDKDGYDTTARSLADRFRNNFSQFQGYVSEEIASVL